MAIYLTMVDTAIVLQLSTVKAEAKRGWFSQNCNPEETEIAYIVEPVILCKYITMMLTMKWQRRVCPERKLCLLMALSQTVNKVFKKILT